MRHMARCAALVLLVASTPASAGSYQPPAPDVLSSIQDHHGRKDWWFVKVDSGRYVVRVRTVDASGLSGLQPRKKHDHVPAKLAWNDIARIDERKSHFRKKQVEGAILGGITGFVLASLGGLSDPLPAMAVFAGAGAGGYLGALYGDGQVHEQPVYISRTLFAAPSTPAVVSVIDSSADSVRTAAALDPARAGADGARAPAPDAGIAAMGAAAPSGGPDHDVIEACRVIQPSSVVRVHADFGLFEGNVAHAGPEGLSGLRLSTHADASAATTPDLVGWERIRKVELRGNHAREGAIGFAIGLGVLGSLVGLAAVASSASGGGDDSGGLWILEGAAIGAAGGALVGAGIGSLGPKWKPVYVR